jgi:class 3 adenylate cyclase/tetratricopeptide (TPR) repeat protein
LSAVPAARERRKILTVIFADVVGSTALGERVDPETLRWAMQRWFGRMREAVERHGGTVENYVGDAVMAVFGIPVAHEDDALRAVRAAAEMRDEVVVLRSELRREREVDLAVRIGVNTGEAVTGASAATGSFTAGDTVNVAARLEQSASPGEVLVGSATWRLVRHAVDAEPVAPLSVKGKSAALEAYRLLGVRAATPPRAQRSRTPMVGRQRELGSLLDAFHQAVADRNCQLVTVLGAAGVGKSRLVAEFLETIGGAATVAAGRCLPYGDGLTWWPLAEALGDGLLDEARAADERAANAVAELLKPAGEPIPPEEALWTVRKVLEALARRRPLIFVVDDLQWAEATFIDLIEHVAQWARDAPLLVLITSRPELLEERPGWGGGKRNATTVFLEPLPVADARELLHQLVAPDQLDDRASEHILDVADGNPLFVEEIVAMVVDDAGSLTTVPPTISALIAARLDRLPPAERAVIEAASIEGKEFARERVAALVEGDLAEAVDVHLRALVRKDLVRPTKASEELFRFRHQLIRDGAYDGMAKELRAALHERFAAGLDARPADIPAADELLAYHLERTVLFRRELGASDGATEQLAARASSSLRAAGQRALLRDDPASVTLLERALALTPEARRAPLLVELADALDSAGDIGRCAATASAALELAVANGDRRSAVRARLMELRIANVQSTGAADLASLNAAAVSVLDELEELGDDEWVTVALVHLAIGNQDHFEQASRYLERALAIAERTGDRRRAALAAYIFGMLTVFGPVPTAEGIERCRTLRQQFAEDPATAAALLRDEAALHAMRGRIDEARAMHAEADRIVEDLGSRWPSATGMWTRCLLELLAGEPRRAEAAARAGLAQFQEMGATSRSASAAAQLALALAQNDGDEAEVIRYADLAAAWTTADDIEVHVCQLVARAHVLARRGEVEAAEAAARQAVRLSEDSDEISQRGDAHVELATVLDRAGRVDAAAAALRDGIALYERKGNIVSAARAKAMFESLEQRARGVDV